MPIADRKLREVMSELEASSGGSLVKHLHRLQITNNRSILFIGLGGLGSKAVNAIKAFYVHEYEYTDKVRFLAVDTCTEDQVSISSGHVNEATGEVDGFMSSDELFQVFDESSVGLLTNIPRPPEIEGWIGNLKPRPLDNSGAQGVRQIGRVMLCGTQKYQQLRNTISDIVDDIHENETPINVVVLAGIAGGTGSGTFIDVSYMVRDILANMAAHDKQVHQWGIFFAPEVQHSIPDIRNNPVIWSSLQRNAYAALKELDYFMSNGSMVTAAAPIYRLVAPGGLVVESAMPIYNDGTVFIVSDNGGGDCAQIINSTARSALSMFQQNTATGDQAFTSDASNIPNYFDIWRNENVGKAADGSEALLGIEGAEFPAFMNYHYLSPSYVSVYFPRDEIMAYCANEVMTKVNDVWQNARRLNQTNVDSWLKATGLDSPEGLLAASKVVMGLRAEELRLNPVTDAAQWPEVTMYLFGHGRVRGTADTMECAAKKADAKVNSINNDDSVAQFGQALAKGLTDKLSAVEFVTNWGPYAAIAALTGYGDVKGACDRLDSMAARLRGAGGYLERLSTAEAAAKVNMQEAARILEADNTPSDGKLSVFIDACQMYSLARFDLGFGQSLMARVIAATKSNLMSFNNWTFATYVPVMTALTEMLNRDSTILAVTDLKKVGNRQTFGMDAFGLNKARANRDLFVNLFGSYVNSDRAGMVAASFAQMMFGTQNRDRWQQLADRPELLAEEVRKVFKSFFAPFVGDMLEKFSVLAYADPRLIQGLTPKRLDQIWDADDGTPDAELRNTAINAAGKAIARMLKEGSKPLVELEGGHSQVDKLYHHSFLTLLDGMDRLNEAILAGVGVDHGVGYIGDNHKSVIRCITYVGPISLPLVKGLSSWAREYFKAEKDADTRAGRHLDERNQDWVRLLPEPFGMDSEEYYDTKQRPDLIIKGVGQGPDAELFLEIRNALARASEAGYLYYAGSPDNCYKIIHGIKLTTTTESGKSMMLRDACDAVIARDPEAKLSDMLHAAKNEFYVADYQETKIVCNNGPLQGRQDATPVDPRKFANLCRIVRMSMRLTTIVLAAEKEYSGAADVQNNGVLEVVAEARKSAELVYANYLSALKYESRLPLFADMLLCNLLEYRPGKRSGMGKWYYRRTGDAPFEELCNISALRPGLELQMTLYLGFAKGVWELPDRVCEILRKTCNKMIDDGNFATPEEAAALQSQARDILNSPELSEPYEDKRDANVLDMVNLSRNPAQYSIPTVVMSAADAYSNIAGFYQELIERLDVA